MRNVLTSHANIGWLKKRTLPQDYSIKIHIPVSYGDIWTNDQVSRPESGFENDKEICQLLKEMWGSGEWKKEYLLRDSIY